MKKLLVYTVSVLCFVAAASDLHARGGGGCLKQGTLVLTPSGNTPVERLKPGDAVLGVNRGSFTRAVVRSVTTVRPDQYIQIIVNGRTGLAVTQEHPIEISFGVFRMASALKIGNKVNVIDKKRIIPGTVTSLTHISVKTPAYNLLVSPTGNYIANGIVVHNKGCFLPETPIRKADGTEISISRIKRHDRVLAFHPDGSVTTATVQKVITHDVDEYRIVKAGNMTLRVTSEHPFYTGSGEFKTLEALNVGDSIYIFDGTRLRSQRIESIVTIHEKTRVYNLQTNTPNTYFANGAAVHNKGGGGGGGGSRSSGFSGRSSSRSSGSSSGSSSEGFFIIFFSIGMTIILVAIVITRMRSRSGNLDYIYSPLDVAQKIGKTIKLIEFIAKHDPAFAPAALMKIVESTFLKLQECWQTREYTPMKPLLMPDLYQDHLLQIQSMVRNHEINMIAQLKIERIDLVNVRYTIKEDQREFTALITATARDYYIDDRTKARLRGDDAPARFQEFWTFHSMSKSWLLREIEQSAESNALKEDNFVEQFTDKTIDHIYGKTASREGPAGPWLEKAVETKESRIERMLNFLVQTDKLWDRNAMLHVSRNVFIKVTVAWESGDLSKVPIDDLFPEMSDNLRKEITKNHDKGVVIEFRNLCVRKAELILVSNFADNSKDEFVVRVRAHAQKIMTRKSTVVQKDTDVTPFDQFLTFGRLDNQWKLKEVVNSRNAQELIKQENVEQESSLQQLRWYYQHKRAL